jgi:peptidyl-prolyl cis-trans isomerase SurA
MDAATILRCLPILTLGFQLGCGFGKQESSPFLADEAHQSRLFDESRNALQTGVEARPQAPVDPPIVIGSPGSTPPTSPVVPVAGVQQNTQPPVTGGTPQSKIVAIIGADGVVTDDEVWQIVRQRSSEFSKLMRGERSAKEKEIFDECLRRLIERELIIADFTSKIKKNKPQVMDELRSEAQASARKAVKALITELRTQNNIATDAEVIEIMNRMPGMSLPLIQRSHERQAIVDIYLGQFVKDKGKQVSLADITRFYAQNEKLFRVDDRVKWQDLFVSYRRFNTVEEAQQYANQLLKQLAKGDDFAQVVKQFGHGDSQLRGGDGLGSKRGEIQPSELEATVFSMKPGETSQLVPTETGIHIIRVLERDFAGLRPLDEKTQQQIKTKLLNDTRETEIKKLIEELWRKITVRIIE